MATCIERSTASSRQHCAISFFPINVIVEEIMDILHRQGEIFVTELEGEDYLAVESVLINLISSNCHRYLEYEIGRIVPDRSLLGEEYGADSFLNEANGMNSRLVRGSKIGFRLETFVIHAIIRSPFRIDLKLQVELSQRTHLLIRLLPVLVRRRKLIVQLTFISIGD